MISTLFILEVQIIVIHVHVPILSNTRNILEKIPKKNITLAHIYIDLY